MKILCIGGPLDGQFTYVEPTKPYMLTTLKVGGWGESVYLWSDDRGLISGGAAVRLIEAYAARSKIV